MKFRINIFGEKVQAFYGEKAVDLGTDAFILGLLTPWYQHGAKPQLFSNAEITRFTADKKILGEPTDDQQARVRKARGRLRDRLLRIHDFLAKMELEQIVSEAEVDAVLFREGIRNGVATENPKKLETALLRYDDRLFWEYRVRDAELEEKIIGMRREYDALFASGIVSLVRMRSPLIHRVVAAKLRQIQDSDSLKEIAPYLMESYKNQVARTVQSIPLQVPDRTEEAAERSVSAGSQWYWLRRRRQRNRGEQHRNSMRVQSAESGGQVGWSKTG